MFLTFNDGVAFGDTTFGDAIMLRKAIVALDLAGAQAPGEKSKTCTWMWDHFGFRG